MAILLTHYLEEADRLASELAIVDRGRIVAQGSPNELKRELRGDTVQVELVESSNGDAAAAVQRLPGVSDLTVDGRMVRARVNNGAAAIPSVIWRWSRTAYESRRRRSPVPRSTTSTSAMRDACSSRRTPKPTIAQRS